MRKAKVNSPQTKKQYIKKSIKQMNKKHQSQLKILKQKPKQTTRIKTKKGKRKAKIKEINIENKTKK